MDYLSWITVNLFLALVTLFVIYLYQHFTELRRLGIPGPTPFPPFGNLHQQLLRGIQNTDEEWFNKYGKVYGMYSGFKPTVVVSDIDVLKSILVKDFSNFTDRGHNGNIPNLLKNGLFFMKGNLWKKTRNIITPTFSAGKLKKLIPIINRCAGTLAENLGKIAGNQNVSVREYYVNFTMDAIASTAFGLDIDSQKHPNDPFVKNIDPIFTQSRIGRLYIMISAMIPGIGKHLQRLGLSNWPKKSVQFYEDVGKALIDDRRKTKTERVDFLKLLIEAELNESDQEQSNGVSVHQNGIDTAKKPLKLTDDEITGQAFVFFLAGYETTSSFLRYASYLLALHPEVDAKLYSEIQQSIGNQEPTYELIQQMKYTDQFVNEVLRFYPPVTRLNRTTKEDITINGFTIPKGASIQIPVWSVQHNPELFENPDKFDPERFATGKIGSSDMSFLAFGVGPRNCIGMRLALVQAKIALVHVLRKVKFVSSSETKEPLDLNHFGILRPRTPVLVGVEKR